MLITCMLINFGKYGSKIPKESRTKTVIWRHIRAKEKCVRDIREGYALHFYSSRNDGTHPMLIQQILLQGNIFNNVYFYVYFRIKNNIKFFL